MEVLTAVVYAHLIKYFVELVLGLVLMLMSFSSMNVPVLSVLVRLSTPRLRISLFHLYDLLISKPDVCFLKLA